MCNSPLNGSLLVYSLGERAETAPAVRVGSHGHLLSVAIHMLELLDWAFLRRIFYPRWDMSGVFFFYRTCCVPWKGVYCEFYRPRL